MKRVILAIVGTVASLVLVLSFKTHSPTAAAVPPAAISSTNSAGTSTGSSPGSSSSSKTSTSSTSKTYTGDAADTRYGPVQVQVVVKNGTVTSVQAVDYPTSDPRDAQINSYAIPQ